MTMPVQLYALTWSADDTAAIQAWEQENADKVGIVGWSRILLEPLDKAAADPNIFSMAIDGVVIRDHAKWPADSLKQAVKKLTAGTLKLYSVTNGAEPITVQDPVQY